MKQVGNEDEAHACISFSPTPVVRYYASSRSTGIGDNAVKYNTSRVCHNDTTAAGFIHQNSPAAFAIPNRSSTPNAPIAGHLCGESEVLVIEQPRSSVEDEPVGLQKEQELEAISKPVKHPNVPSNDDRKAGLSPNSKSQPANIDSPINLSTIANVVILGDLHDLQKGNRALTMLTQLPSFGSSPSTMRFDRWIKLFDNIVSMSDWTSDETVNMLVTKLTGEAHELLQNILDTVTKDYKKIKKLLHDRFHGNENQDFFQAQLEEIEHYPGENIIAYGFRLKNIFERGYPKNGQAIKDEESTRFQILRQKFLAGIDPKLKYKVRYKYFKVYEDLVLETDKYARRLEAEKKEISKRKFVNAVTAPLSQSDSHLLCQAIETQNEKINAFTSASRFNPQHPDTAFIQISNDDLNNRVMEILHHYIGYQHSPSNAPYFHSPNPPNYYAQQNGGYNFRCPASDPLIQNQLVDPQIQPFPPLINCYFCGNAGHRRSECRKHERVATQMFSLRGKEARLMPLLPCYKYGSIGHQPSSCFNNEPITCGSVDGNMGRTV